ncbi:MAG: class I SAM-dependent methyltransferase [Gammaproteobacteria bacterium]|nr:class I SAM-dependent methyltransferase [Gammaproteobacteria bacterium]
MNQTRRGLIKALAAVLACASVRNTEGQDGAERILRSNIDDPGNFRFIYGHPDLRQAFQRFLTNVFHLYPEDAFDELIGEAAATLDADRDIYAHVQPRLDTIKPFLGDLTYALPALSKQKRVLGNQTRELLDTDVRYEGYVEVGSNGRYLDALEERLTIVGDVFLVSDEAPTLSPADVLDRGQLFEAGRFLPLRDYETDFAASIPAGSVDLVTVYIGFHHCPPDLRQAFFESLRTIMAPGGTLIVRDHDVDSDRMWRMVALAHDVFNMGTNETWDYNARERRHFYSLAELDAMLTRAGFESDGRRLFQDGDPTLNALMRYDKV